MRRKKEKRHGWGEESEKEVRDTTETATRGQRGPRATGQTREGKEYRSERKRSEEKESPKRERNKRSTKRSPETKLASGEGEKESVTSGTEELAKGQKKLYIEKGIKREEQREEGCEWETKTHQDARQAYTKRRKYDEENTVRRSSARGVRADMAREATKVASRTRTHQIR
ncbi:hypothetical protein WJX77_000672 [Trebouxia sp. C0004]